MVKVKGMVEVVVIVKVIARIVKDYKIIPQASFLYYG